MLAALAARYPGGGLDDDRSLFVGVLAACDGPSVGDALSDRQSVERLTRQHSRIAERLRALHRAYRRGLDQLRILGESIEVDTGAAHRLP